MAVELGLADRSVLKQPIDALVPLGDGVRKYLDYVARPPVLGGVGPRTVARYRAVFDKFARFAGEQQVRYWQQVTNAVLEKYGGWLDAEDYAGRSQYLELTTVKQAVKWMVREKMLPQAALLTTPRPQGPRDGHVLLLGRGGEGHRGILPQPGRPAVAGRHRRRPGPDRPADRRVGGTPVVVREPDPQATAPAGHQPAGPQVRPGGGADDEVPQGPDLGRPLERESGRCSDLGGTS